MIRFLWMLSVRARDLLWRTMPTNILLGLIRTRRGLKWGMPAMILAMPYLLVASICTNLIAEGWPGWLNLLVLLCVWNALKFIVMGPVSAATLVRHRLREASARHSQRDLSGGQELGAQQSLGASIQADATRYFR